MILKNWDIPTEGALQRRHQHTVNKTPIYPGKPGRGDAFAPAPASCACTDRAGYHRRHHAFDNDSRCIFCGSRSAA